MSELDCFISIPKEDLDKANESEITDKNNSEFKSHVRAWYRGDYDNDPDLLLARLLIMLNN